VPASIDKAIFTHHVFALRPRERTARPDVMWLYGALRDPTFRDRAVTFATGTTVLALPKDALLTYEVPWPDQETRHGWANEAQALLSVADAYATENRMLATLRDTLLPGLMSGKVRVRDVDKNAGETS
jgi:type I restriction enzyme, S subunit